MHNTTSDAAVAPVTERIAADWVSLDRVPAHELSYQRFLKDYVHAGKPVVVSGAAAHWPALAKWTPLYFKERFGKRLVPVSREKSMPFDEFADAVMASTDRQPGPYMFRCFLRDSLPELLADVVPRNKYNFSRRHASPLMPKHWYEPGGYMKLLVGGAGSKFPIVHFDGENAHAFITQVHGEKEFVLFAPEDGPYLYPKEIRNQSRVDDPLLQDRTRFPLLAKASPFRAVLQPGDMIFVPARWWHTARVAGASISVGANMLDGSNWSGFVADVAGSRRKSLMRARLLLTGLVLSGLEELQTRAPKLARLLVLPRLLAPISVESTPQRRAGPSGSKSPTPSSFQSLT